MFMTTKYGRYWILLCHDCIACWICCRIIMTPTFVLLIASTEKNYICLCACQTITVNSLQNAPILTICSQHLANQRLLVILVSVCA